MNDVLLLSQSFAMMKYNIFNRRSRKCMYYAIHNIFKEYERMRVCQSSITFKLVAGNYVIGVTSLNFEFV